MGENVDDSLINGFYISHNSRLELYIFIMEYISLGNTVYIFLSFKDVGSL